jgi:hypothetical protein
MKKHTILNALILMVLAGAMMIAVISCVARKEFSFSFDKPTNMSRAVESLQSEISKHNGTLTGNNLEQQGSFRASGVVGSYIVTERVDVTITDKPWYLSETYIESEVIKWFKNM